MAYRKLYLFDGAAQEVADFGFVLSHPARQQIIKALAQYEVLSKSDIISLSPLSDSAISDHLRYLERAQLIRIDENMFGKTGYVLNEERYEAYLILLNDWLKEVQRSIAA